MYIEHNGWGSLTELAKKVGKSPSYLSKRISLLELPDDVLHSVRIGDVSPSLAEELLSLEEPKLHSKLAILVVQRHLTMKKTRELAKALPRVSEDIVASKPAAVLKAELEVSHAARALTKAVTVLRLALDRLASIIDEDSESWIVKELLLRTRQNIHKEIDVLLRERAKTRTHGRFLLTHSK
jgi:ParB family chromosome partitioning protein